MSGEKSNVHRTPSARHDNSWAIIAIFEDIMRVLSPSTVCDVWINMSGAQGRILDLYLVHVVNSAQPQFIDLPKHWLIL